MCLFAFVTNHYFETAHIGFEPIITPDSKSGGSASSPNGQKCHATTNCASFQSRSKHPCLQLIL